MVVQAAVASDLVRRDRAAAAAALQDVAQAGRDALAETGRLLRLIRDERDELGLQRSTTLTKHGPPTLPAKADVRRATIPLTDLLLPALLGVVGTVEMVWEGYAPLWASIGAYWLAVVVLCVRRALPLAMPVAVDRDRGRGRAARDRYRRARVVDLAACPCLLRDRPVCAALARAGRACVRPRIDRADRHRWRCAGCAVVGRDMADRVRPGSVGDRSRAPADARAHPGARGRGGAGSPGARGPGRARRRRGAQAHRSRAARCAREVAERDDRAGVAGGRSRRRGSGGGGVGRCRGRAIGKDGPGRDGPPAPADRGRRRRTRDTSAAGRGRPRPRSPTTMHAPGSRSTSSSTTPRADFRSASSSRATASCRRR